MNYCGFNSRFLESLCITHKPIECKSAQIYIQYIQIKSIFLPLHPLSSGMGSPSLFLLRSRSGAIKVVLLVELVEQDSSGLYILPDSFKPVKLTWTVRRCACLHWKQDVSGCTFVGAVGTDTELHGCNLEQTLCIYGGPEWRHLLRKQPVFNS